MERADLPRGTRTPSSLARNRRRRRSIRVDLPGETGESRSFTSIEPAGKRESRFAIGTIVASGIIFALAAPFAKTELGQVPAFIPSYVSALIVCDAVTAALLFSQYRLTRSTELLVLASGYVFTAFATAAYGLVFPGLYPIPEFLMAGPQTTSAMYMFWHAGFPLIVIAYALLPRGTSEAPAAQTGRRPLSTGIMILATIALVFGVVCAFTLFATLDRDYIPQFIAGNKTTVLGKMVLITDWLLSLTALTVLWRRRPHTVIDLWLMIVMCVWLFDIALSALLNAGRYDLGWYVGRIYGLVAASYLLVLLLIESGNNYARLVGMSTKLRRANDVLEKISMQDGLTAVANRRSFDAYLTKQIAIARRYKRPLSLLLFDIDSFKAYNDHFGHQAGDDCLKAVATAMQSCCRRTADMTARYGGEEFAIILPETDLAGALMVGETVRSAVEGLGIPHAPGVGPYVTISGGVSVLPWIPSYSVEQLIAEADRNLFVAKRSGRNRVCPARERHGEASRGDEAASAHRD